MEYFEIESRTGVLLGDLESLVRGNATAAVAQRLGVTMGDLEDFINGSATAAMTKRLGLITISAAKELACVAGPKGAVGILLGMLLWDSSPRS
jgi:hypothetical protein